MRSAFAVTVGWRAMGEWGAGNTNEVAFLSLPVITGGDSRYVVNLRFSLLSVVIWNHNFLSLRIFLSEIVSCTL